MPDPAADARHMARALELAVLGRGAVEPNPMVGAVVVAADGRVVGEGFHEHFGGPHAEVNAFAAAGEAALGGTLYVSLEPCCHVGKTPPCTDVVKASGVTRVVAAMADPFPQVAGGGLKILRSAGLEVDVGLGEAEARQLNAPYLKLLTTGRPWIHLKWAMSLDGRIATKNGDSQWVTGERARALGHQLRGRCDAVMVGRGTVEMDNPELTARPAGPRVPTRIILTASGILPDRCKLRSTARDIPVLVITAAGNEEKLEHWADDGAEIIGLPARGEKIAVERILHEFGKRRWTNVLVEGGAGVLGTFLDGLAADELHVFVAPKIIGGEGAMPAVLGHGVDSMAEAVSFRRGEWSIVGDDFYFRARR
jgi:diaminohydroxyphosphoribosylaminopyrimidine deaminase / 5-amino-6-(5-phosphoribosylamino)uracil reductase